MKKCDYYANPNYKITQEDLLERLKYYKMVYHSDDRLHLLSFILLQDSVFQPKGFFDKFEKNTLLNTVPAAVPYNKKQYHCTALSNNVIVAIFRKLFFSIYFILLLVNLLPLHSI